MEKYILSVDYRLFYQLERETEDSFGDRRAVIKEVEVADTGGLTLWFTP